MSENKIYEITRLMGDAGHASSLVRGMLHEKYIRPIESAIAAEGKKVRKNLSNEARLLAALKPFVPATSQKNLEQTMEMLHLLETAKGLSRQMPPPATRQPLRAQETTCKDEARHADGIYEIDKNCQNILNKGQNESQCPFAPLLMMLALLSFTSQQF